MLLDTHIPVFGRAVPYLSGIAVHVFGGHADCRIVVSLSLLELYLLVADCLVHPRGVDESILGAVAFSDNGDNGKDFTVLMSCLLGFQTNGVVDGLIAGYLVGGDVHETNGFASGDDSCHLLIDGEYLHFLIGLLRKSGSGQDCA